jgi:TolB-like protein
MRLTLAAAVLLVSASAAAQTAQTRPQLAVLDFEARNVDPALAQSMTDAAAGALRELRVFKVISQGEIRQLLAVERQRELLAAGCEDNSCIGKIGDAVGARWIVSGQVMALEKDKPPFTLRVRLFDMKKMEVQSDESRPNLESPRAALEAAPGAALVAVRPILDKEQGYLELISRENGAKVSIDGRLVGLTPFPMQKLGWGPHRVVVEKQGFIAWAKDVQVERNQATAETVALVPSPEFIDAYHSRNLGLRAGAIATTVVAVLAAGAAVGIQAGPVEDRYGKFKPFQDYFNSPSNNATANPCGTMTASQCYDHATWLKNQGAQWQWGAIGAGIGAAVCAGLATYFWIAGDDPGKYDTYRGLNVTPATPAEPPKAAIVPLKGGGAMGSFSFSFGGP